MHEVEQLLMEAKRLGLKGGGCGRGKPPRTGRIPDASTRCRFWWRTNRHPGFPTPRFVAIIEPYQPFRYVDEQAFRYNHRPAGTPLSLEDARRLVAGDVEHYNDVRLNSAIGYVTPKDLLAGRSRFPPV